MFGQQVGFVSLNCWLGIDSIYLKEPATVTLTVESNFAIVLKVSAVDLNLKFPAEVRKSLINSSIGQLDNTIIRSK